MKRLLLFCALFAASACAAGGKPISMSDFYGNWKVTKINVVDDITTSASYRQALVGTVIHISAEKVTEAGEDDCLIDPSTDKVSMVNSAQEMWPTEGVTPHAVGLPLRVEKLELSCMDFYKVGDRLVFGDRGAWYTAERVIVAESPR